MPAPETKILLAIKTRVIESGITPVAWAGEPFEAKEAGYYEFSLQYAPPLRQVIFGRKSRRTGLIMLRFSAAYGRLTQEVMTEHVANVLDTFFYMDSTHRYLDVCVRVTDAPTVMRGYRDGGYWHVPGRIEWETYA